MLPAWIQALALPALAFAPANMEGPDPKLAPGKVSTRVKQGNISETICNPRWIAKAKPTAKSSEALMKKQLKAWGYDDRDVTHYVEDHVIPVEVGGHPTDAKNQWPQSVGDKWNAATKDKLEEYVNREVCSGRMTLKEGQSVFQKGWVDVFHVYCGAQPDDVCTMPGSPVLLENTKPVAK